MNKGIELYKGDILSVFQEASNILFDAVSHTLGNNGMNTAIPTPNKYLSIINDGKTILEQISSPDPAVCLALNTLKESSFATNQNAGDGTTSTTILQHKLLEDIIAYNAVAGEKDVGPITSDYIYKVRDYLLESLPMFRKEIETQDDLKRVIEVSLGSKDLVDLVYKAFQDLSRGQKPTLVKNNTSKTTELVTIDGINLSPVDINPVVLQHMDLTYQKDCNILIVTQQISRIDAQFKKLLTRISQSDKPTVLLYTEIMPSVMDQLLFNIQEGGLNLVPIRLGIPLDKLDDIINELCRHFECLRVDDLHPYQTCYNDPNLLGICNGYILSKDSVVIKLDKTVEEVTYLPTKSSIISVGFITYSQQEETYRRLEDAINSAYNALDSGYVIGAGYTYLSMALCDLDSDKEFLPIKDALIYIYRSLKLATHPDMKEQDYIDILMDNVYDSYKVAEQVILNAFTVVAQVLSTKCLLVPIDTRKC